MSLTEKTEYFRRVEEHWKKWSRFLFLSAKDMQAIEQWWQEKVPLHLVFEAIDSAFTGLFRKSRKRFFSLASLHRGVEKLMKRRAEAAVGKAIERKEVRTEGIRVEQEEIRELLEKAAEAIRGGRWEEAEELDGRITELVWEQASQQEKEEALHWAEEKLRQLKVDDKVKKDLVLNGAKRRLRERKGIPFIF